MALSSVPLADPSLAITPAEQLIVLPLPARWVDGSVLYDLQSRDSLVRYLDHFETLIMALPRLPEAQVQKLSAEKGFVWVSVDDLRDRVQFVPLPGGGSMSDYLFKDLGPTTKRLRECINAAKYIQCAIGGGNGGLEYDWAYVAAREAHRMGRSYSLLSDMDHSGVTAQRMNALKGVGSLPKRLKLRLKIALLQRRERLAISHCNLIFCNGMDTYQAYSRLCRSPDMAVKINDFQIGPDQFLDADSLERKCADALQRTDLRLVYAGRVEPQKAPLDWVKAMHEARRLGANLKATWLGDGSIRNAMREEVERLNMSDMITLPGFVSNREHVIRAIREADVMPFTHMEPESPRVLIEALMSACPIVGYDRPHPRDLISEHGGGIITPLGDWKAMGASLAALAADRTRLVELMRQAWSDGSRFNSDVMTRNRSKLIRERLS